MRAGFAAVPLEPPLGLALFGSVSQTSVGSGYGLPLEASAVVLDAGGTRLAMCGVDICGINVPDIDPLIERVAAELGMDPAGVLLNWGHTHQGVLGGHHGGYCMGPPQPERDQLSEIFGRIVQEKIVTACRLAAGRLERADLVWGVGSADLAVNRRERTSDGETILGWNPDRFVDNQVTVLQARRPDESVIGTVVSYGCHPVTVGWQSDLYSADYPGALRRYVRQASGGECVFLQAAGGNVLPRIAFLPDETEAVRMGNRLGIEALHAVADRFAAPRELVRRMTRSVMPIAIYRFEPLDSPPQTLGAARREVTFPLQQLPTLEEIRAMREEFEALFARARHEGDLARVNTAYYNLGWALETEAAIRDGTAQDSARGWIHALRIGDGVIVTGPGETFTEIGMAVKERAPGRPTLYCGYSNGYITYFATAEEYAYGGYEAGYGNRGFGLPAQVTAESERTLVETGVRLAESLFPDCEPWPADAGFVATGRLPTVEQPTLEHPAHGHSSQAATI